MSYTAPLGSSVDFKFDGASYTAPLGSGVNFSFAIQDRVVSGAVDIQLSVGGYCEAFEYVTLYSELAFDVTLTSEINAYPVGRGSLVITPVFGGGLWQDPILFGGAELLVDCTGVMNVDLIVSGIVLLPVDVSTEIFHDQPSVIQYVIAGVLSHGVLLNSTTSIPLVADGAFFVWRQFSGTICVEVIVDGTLQRGTGLSGGVVIDVSTSGILEFLPLNYFFGDASIPVALSGILETPIQPPPNNQLFTRPPQGVLYVLE